MTAGVLARSGRWGYRVDDPYVLCQPYRAEEGPGALSVFFRDASLADHIGFHALYDLLEREGEIQTVTFAEYLDGNPARGVRPHRLNSQAKVYDLFTGSSIDEMGSAPGADLGTWIGEGEENRAWELLGATRDEIERRGANAEDVPAAFEALYAAEGSDWFWWLGDDQDSGNDPIFDELFRGHVKNLYLIAVPAGTQDAEGGATREGRYAPEMDSGDA